MPGRYKLSSRRHTTSSHEHFYLLNHTEGRTEYGDHYGVQRWWNFYKCDTCNAFYWFPGDIICIFKPFNMWPTNSCIYQDENTL